MNRDEFVRDVQRKGHAASADEAWRSIHATFETLSARLAAGEPANLAAQLPPGVREAVPGEGDGERFGADEPYLRVARTLGVEDADARRLVQAVTSTMAETVEGGALRKLGAQLPAQYAEPFSAEMSAAPR